MTPKPDKKSGSVEDQENSEIFSDRYKQILKANGITDTMSEIIIKVAGLRGSPSLTQYVTVKFDNPDKKPLNQFVIVQTENASTTETLDEMKAFEKEARFLTSYVGAAKEMCKLKGRPDFIDFYPRSYYGDDKMIVMENLVLDKGYSLKIKKNGRTWICPICYKNLNKISRQWIFHDC